MSTGQTLLIYTPLANQPPASSFALFSTLNGMPILNFATGTINYAIFPGIMPRNYSGGGITITYHWTGDAAPASHNVVWKGDWERNNSGASITSDNFDTANAQSTTTAAPTLGQITTTAITFTNGQIGGTLAGEAFRFRAQRNGTNGSDNFTGNSQLVRIEVKET